MLASRSVRLSMLRRFSTLSALLGLAVALAWTAPVSAQDGEVSFVIGALFGDDLDLGLEELENSFDNAPLFGGRIGVYGHPFGLEGSLVVSPSSVPEFEDIELGGLDVRIMYAEVNALLIILPGPLSPFATGGVGIHSFKFEDTAFESTENQLGFNFGGGIKGNIGPLAVRLDIRDHLTSFDPDDVDPVLVPILGLDDEHTVHNWEVSAGIGVHF